MPKPTPPIIDEYPTEHVLYHEHPAMFRNHPIWFVICILLIPVVVGAVLLLVWWFDTRSKTLIVTDKRTVLRRGILSKSLNDIMNQDVRNIQVTQSVFQRLMGVGNVAISSSGQATVEIEAKGIPDPDSVRQFINQSR